MMWTRRQNHGSVALSLNLIWLMSLHSCWMFHKQLDWLQQINNCHNPRERSKLWPSVSLPRPGLLGAFDNNKKPFFIVIRSWSKTYQGSECIVQVTHFFNLHILKITGAYGAEDLLAGGSTRIHRAESFLKRWNSHRMSFDTAESIVIYLRGLFKGFLGVLFLPQQHWHVENSIWQTMTMTCVKLKPRWALTGRAVSLLQEGTETWPK